MTNKKELNEIRPAKGAVKIKRKNSLPKSKHESARVIQNISENKISEPTEEALQIELKLNIANKELMNSMKAFNSLLNDQTLPENKSSKDKNMEQSIVNRLASAALVVESLSSGQGLLGLSILAIRQSLSLRDAGNYLAYKLSQVEEKLVALENKVTTLFKSTSDDSRKEYLKGLAEKMGFKISVE